MTCKEKLTIEHPEEITPHSHGGCNGCPSDYDYLPDPDYCEDGIAGFADAETRCSACWNRTIPDKNENRIAKEALKNEKETIQQLTDIRDKLKRENEYLRMRNGKLEPVVRALEAMTGRTIIEW